MHARGADAKVAIIFRLEAGYLLREVGPFVVEGAGCAGPCEGDHAAHDGEMRI